MRQAIYPLEVPGSDGKPVIIKVQRPRLLAMASQGKIPNRLMAVATRAAGGKVDSKKKVDITDIAKMVELYCLACMVEPTFDAVKNVMNDDQMLVIFEWATSEVNKIAPFRGNESDGKRDTDGKGLPGKAK